MTKPWNLTMAQAMLTLKKDTLPPAGKEALEHVIPLLQEKANNGAPSRILKVYRKKFLAWYESRDANGEEPDGPEAALLEEAGKLCIDCREAEAQTDAEEYEHIFQAALLQAVENYRKQVDIPVIGDAVVRLKYNHIKKEILEEHGIAVRRYFFDPGQYGSEITEAVERFGEPALQKIFGHRELAFRITRTYLRELIPLADYCCYIKDWPRDLERALKTGNKGCIDEFLWKLMAEGVLYLKETDQDREEEAKIRFDQELTRLFLTWAAEFEKEEEGLCIN